ncbi:MAG: TrkA C-terminal domain-containing protein, partial [Gaiellaceae bacterium]
WGGLKGAVPILLAAFALLAGVPDARKIYGIVFVVVLFSVLVQGTSIPWAAHRLGVPMRVVEQEPWDLSIRLRREPHDVERYVVGVGSRADGQTIRDLPLSEHVWINMLVRAGGPVATRGQTVLQAGDELIVLTQRAGDGLRRLFEGPA